MQQLHLEYKPKATKRKIASIKALFHYLEYKDAISRNPLNKIHVKFRDPVLLSTLRDIAVIELLFATEMRISELCSLKMNNVNLYDRSILIYWKSSKERRLQIGDDDVR